MNDVTRAAAKAWALHCTAEMARHISESVADLLPDDLHAVAAGLQVVLEKTPSNAPPRAVRSFHVPPFGDFETTPIDHVAHHILTDLQDEVAMHLRRAWPINDVGIPLHAWADRNGDTIELTFRGEGVNADARPIELPPFPIPPGPTETVIVG